MCVCVVGGQRGRRFDFEVGYFRCVVAAASSVSESCCDCFVTVGCSVSTLRGGGENMLRPKRMSVSSDTPGTPSKLDRKGSGGDKPVREGFTQSLYYPFDYWLTFTIGFFVSYLIFSSGDCRGVLPTLSGGHRTGVAVGAQKYSELLTANIALREAMGLVEIQLENCNRKLSMFSNTESGRELLANKARSDAKEAAPSEEAADASAREASPKAAIERTKHRRVSEGHLLDKRSKAASGKRETQPSKMLLPQKADDEGSKTSFVRSSTAQPKPDRVKPTSRSKDFDLSRWSVWDIPVSELYENWEYPPAPQGSILRKQWVVGVIEEKPLEAKLAVKFALNSLPDGVHPLGPGNSFKLSDIKNNFVNVERFERRVDRFYGIFYSIQLRVHFQDGGSDLFGIRLSKPFRKLAVESVTSLRKERPKLVNVIVSVSNRGKQLQAMIDSLLPIKDKIRLVVVDHTSTDSNPRTMLFKSGLPNRKFLWAPKTIKTFSRALMLDYAIRSLGDDEIFFTCDVDMLLPKRLLEIVALSVVKGSHVYAPEVFQLKKGYTTAKKDSGSFFGWGYGMIGAYKSDYVQIKGYDIKKFRYGWGGEDIDLINRFVRSGYTVIRPQEYTLLHRWHPHLSWRKDSKCDFSWKAGTYCSSHHDAHATDSVHTHAWTFSLSPYLNCDIDGDKDLLIKHAASVDIPSGGYKITHGNNTLGGNRHVHIRAVHAYLADSEPTEAGLQHLETVYSDQISMASAAGAYHFHTNKSARVYFWVSPCDGTKENPRSKIEVTLSSSETRYKL